jgi:hypothetical protein
MAGDLAQDFLFQRIREMIPQHISLVDAVSDILNVSSDSAYRRIRGETPLVLEEARQLCARFHLSLDQILGVNSSSTLFQITRINAEDYNFRMYLEDLFKQLKYIEGFIQKEILFVTKDLHIFCNMISQPFFEFRYFFWNKSIVVHPDYATKAFTLNSLSPEVLSLAREMVKSYNRIPSTEIWNIEAVNSIIFQIEYYKAAGFFSSASDIKTIYDSVEETLYHLKEEAELGTKFYPGENPSVMKQNYRFYYNSIVLGDNTIVVVTDHIKTTFLNYDTLNYMVTRDEKFCNETHDKIQNLSRRSALISDTGERQRDIFFNILVSKIQERKKHL